MRVSLPEADTEVRGCPGSRAWFVQPSGMYGQPWQGSSLSPVLPKQSCKPALRDHFEAAPYYQRRLNLYDEREHLEQYPVDSCRCLPKACVNCQALVFRSKT